MTTEEQEKQLFDLLMEYSDGKKTQAQLKLIVMKLAELIAEYAIWDNDLSWINCPTATAYIKSKTREFFEQEIFEHHVLNCEFCRQNRQILIFMSSRMLPSEVSALITEVMKE